MTDPLQRFTLGARENEVRETLALLDSLTEQLEKCVVDDVHLSSRMADGVRKLTVRLRQMFIRIQAPNGSPGDLSRGNSRPATPQTANHMPPANQHYGQSQGQPTRPTMAPNAFSFDPRLNNHFPDPLADIQRQTMADVADISFMPPTNYDQYMEPNPGNFATTPGQDVDGMGAPTDWFALPIGQIIGQDSRVPVHQGIGGLIGPTVGSRDVLEIMMHDQNGWPALNSHLPGPGAGPMTGPTAGPHRMPYPVNGTGNAPGVRPGYRPPHV